MAKPTISFPEITANPSRLVDCPPATGPTRLGNLHKIEEGQKTMNMMSSMSVLDATPIDVFAAEGAQSPLVADRTAVSRRDVASALLILPAVAAPAIATAASAVGSVQAAPSLEMVKAIDAYHRAVATQNDWEARVYAPAWKACQAAGEKIPHLTTENRCELGAAGALTNLSTDNPGHLSAARIYQKVTVDGERLGGGIAAAMDEFLEKLEWREAEKKRIHRAHSMDALDEEQDRLESVSHRAMAAVDDFPAASLADLIAKIEFGKETDSRIDHDNLLADLRRLATGVTAATSAPAVPVAAKTAFDPAAWIRQYLALGGTISIRSGEAWYAYAPENEEVAALVMDCSRVPEQWDAVRAHANRAFA